MVDWMKWIETKDEMPLIGEYVVVTVEQQWMWSDAPTRTYYLAAREEEEGDKWFWWAHNAGKELKHVVRWLAIPPWS